MPAERDLREPSAEPVDDSTGVCSLLVRFGPDTCELALLTRAFVCLVASGRVGFTRERRVRNRIGKVSLVWRVGERALPPCDVVIR